MAKKTATIDELCKMLGWSRRTWFYRITPSETNYDYPDPITASWPFRYYVADIIRWAKAQKAKSR